MTDQPPAEAHRIGSHRRRLLALSVYPDTFAATRFRVSAYRAALDAADIDLEVSPFLDAQTLRDGRHLLVYNPTSLCRSPLVAALSDDGRNWRAVAHLDGGRREYSYPSIAQSADGLVHVAYTWRRSAIALATLDPAAL